MPFSQAKNPAQCGIHPVSAYPSAFPAHSPIAARYPEGSAQSHPIRGRLDCHEFWLLCPLLAVQDEELFAIGQCIGLL
jgi:hypothetical protein